MRSTLLTLAAAACLAATCLAQPGIDPAHKFAWQENTGFTNWADGADGYGVRVAATYLRGVIWGENIGWIIVGNGPADGVQYSNLTGLDFGVNLDPLTGELSGRAWGENVGWFNFGGGAQASPPNPARLDVAARRFRGYVWCENIGWLNLDDLDKYVGLECSGPGGPTITQHPVDGQVCGTGTVAFSVAVDDPSGVAVTTQWQYRGGPVADWTEVVEGDNTFGGVVVLRAHRETLTSEFQNGDIPDEQDFHDFEVRVVVSGSCGSSISNPAALAFAAPPAVTQQPVSSSACVGGVASSSVDASGGGLSFQWELEYPLSSGLWVALQDGPLSLPGLPPMQVSGARTRVNQLENVLTNLGLLTRCVVSNSCSTVTSALATVSFVQPLSISQQPSSSSVCPDGAVTVSVAADQGGGGAGGLLYRWQWLPPGASSTWVDMVEGDNVDPTDGSLAFHSTDTQSFGVGVTAVKGTFTVPARCVVTNSCGSLTSDAATITFSSPLQLWKPLASSTSPSPRFSHAMSRDSGNNLNWLFGGKSSIGPDAQVLTDTWSFDGLIWSPRSNLSVHPEAGDGAAMSNRDVKRMGGKIALCGGRFADGTLSDETWTWDSSAWSLLSSVHRPPACTGAQLVVLDRPGDAATDGRLYLFGGEGVSGDLGQLWVHDGVDWSLVSATGPSARHGHAMVCDSSRGRLVLVGGSFGSGSSTAVLDDTWEFDGTSWSQLSSLHSPGPRTGHAAVYDQVSGTVLLIGGRDQFDNPRPDMWSWDGEDWTQQYAPGLRENPRTQSVVVGGETDQDCGGALYMFGGLSSSGASDEMFTLERAVSCPTPSSVSTCDGGGATFSVDVPSSPSGTPHTFVWGYKFPGDNTPIIRGSALNGNNYASDGRFLFTASGADTSSLHITNMNAALFFESQPQCDFRCVVSNECGSLSSGPATLTSDSLQRATTVPFVVGNDPPQARFGHAMCGDTDHFRLVMFGGMSSSVAPAQMFTDTWEFDGLIWSPKSNLLAYPTAGENPAMAFDRAHHVTVLFGGRFADGTPSDETWTYDGQAWQLQSPSVRPPKRDLTPLVYRSGSVLLFGGRGETGDLGDLWSWDGTVWSQRSSAGITSRRGHTLAFDDRRDRLVVFGGLSGTVALGDTWEWDGVLWSQKNPLHSPSPRSGASALYDPSRREMLVIGGRDQFDNLLSDVWSWDGVDWKQEYVPGMVQASGAVAVSYRLSDSTADVCSARVLMFGGLTNSGASSDTVAISRDVSCPADQTVSSLSSASFSIDDSSTGLSSSRTYQWQAELDPGVWTNLVDGVLVHGGVVLGQVHDSTSNTLLIDSLVNFVDDRDLLGLRCMVSNSCGSAPSSVAVLSVVAPPEITQQPSDATVCHTGPATTEVQVAGDPGSFTFQWKLEYPPGSGQSIDLLDGVLDLPGLAYPYVISGSQTRVLSGQPQIVDNKKGLLVTFCLVARTGAVVPGTSTLSSAAHLTHVPQPVITIDPVDASSCQGSDAEMSVTASDEGSGGGAGGSSSLSYQWQIDLDPPSTWVDLTDGPLLLADGRLLATVSGATTQAARIKRELQIDRERFGMRCVVTNACSSVTSPPASLFVISSGTRWEKVDNSELQVSPPARFGHAMSVDTDRGRVVLFGGRSAPGAGGAVLTDTWEYDGLVWSSAADLPGATGPQAALRSAMAYDPVSHEMMLFGGQFSDGSSSSETWTFDGTAWSQASPPHSPSSRDGAVSVRWVLEVRVDRIEMKCVMFGGQGPNGDLGDTWAWDGSDWALLSDVGPPARAGHAMAVLDNKLYMFGGRSSSASTGVQVLGDTWRFDGATWSQVVTAHSPPARFDHAMVTDDGLHAIVLVGGNTGINELLPDTWIFDGVDWTQQTAPGLSARGPRQSVSLDGSFASAHPERRLMLFGGLSTDGALDDTVILVRDISDPGSAAVCASSVVSFSAPVGGSAPPGSLSTHTYRWSVLSRPPGSAAVLTEVQDGPNLDSQGQVAFIASGAHTSTLSVHKDNFAQGHHFSVELRCTATNECGDVTSNFATFTASDGPTLTAQPQDVSACPTSQATFSVAVAGNDPGAGGSPATYQWQAQLDPGVWSNLADGDLLHGGIVLGHVSGATSSSMMIDSLLHMVEDRNVLGLRCVVGDTCGGVTSNEAALVVVTRGDMNCDCLVNNFDIDPFVLGLLDPVAFSVAYPGCDVGHGDASNDGLFNNFDIDPFVSCIVHGGVCP